MAKRKSKRSIDWEYCECGCHGFTVSIGDEYFWAYVHLPSEKISVYSNTHGPYGTRIGTFDSFEEADAAVVDKIKSSGTMEQLENELRKVKAILGKQ